jgi:ubiquinone/menaquinone biosynthesis C-methylase UbiE
LLERLASEDANAAAAFGRHVHWGYWEEPPSTVCTPPEYAAAADRLCRAVCDVAEIRDGMRIVDVGCGVGGTLASLNERFRDLRMVGVNIDPRQLDRAAELVQPRGATTLELFEADASRMPLRDASCDILLAVESVFHFDRPGFFAEADRLLGKHGNLTLSDFVPNERAVEYLGGMDVLADEAVDATYGRVDLSYSLGRYRELAAANHLQLSVAIDITRNTLPTYDFLLSTATQSTDAREAERFTRATRRLAKASRKGLLTYQILRFDRP